MSLSMIYDRAVKAGQASYPVYTVRDNLEALDWLNGAQKVGEVMFTQDGGDPCALLIRDGCAVSATRSGSGRLSSRDCLDETVKAGLVSPDMEIRFLDMPQIGVQSLWLRKGGDDVFVPYNLGRVGDPPAYAVDPDFIPNVCRRAVEKRQAYEAVARLPGVNPGDPLGGG